MQDTANRYNTVISLINIISLHFAIAAMELIKHNQTHTGSTHSPRSIFQIVHENLLTGAYLAQEWELDLSKSISHYTF